MTKKASPCAWRLTRTSIRDSSSDEDDWGREWRGDSQSGGAGSSGDVEAVSSKERGRCRTEGCVLRAHSDEAFDGYCCRRCPSGVHGKLCEGVLCDSMKSVAPVSPIKKVNRASREVGATTAVAGGAGKKSPVKEREGGAALPKGWKEFWSEEFGIAYYWHDESEIAVWSRPDEAVAECRSEEECIGNDASVYVRHVVDGKLEDIYCIECFEGHRLKRPGLECVPWEGAARAGESASSCPGKGSIASLDPYSPAKGIQGRGRQRP